MAKTCHYSIIVLFILASFQLTAQVKIGDNPTSINQNSLLELESTNKGFILPRVSLTNTALSSPLASDLLTGTMVYNTNTGITGGNGIGVYVWIGTKWVLLRISQGRAWRITGNDSTNSSSNFIGTIDSAGLSIRTVQKEAIHINSLQRVSVGNNTAITNFDVTGGIRSSNLTGGGAVTANSNGILTLAPGGITGSVNFDYTVPAATTVPSATLSLLGLGSLISGKLDLTITLPASLPNTIVSIDV